MMKYYNNITILFHITFPYKKNPYANVMLFCSHISFNEYFYEIKFLYKIKFIKYTRNWKDLIMRAVTLLWNFIMNTLVLNWFYLWYKFNVECIYNVANITVAIVVFLCRREKDFIKLFLIKRYRWRSRTLCTQGTSNLWHNIA